MSTPVDVESDYGRAASLLEEAIALDSAFAMAWRKLAVVYFNSGAPYDKLLHASRKAYEHRERLTEVERYHTIAFYHFNVTEDMPQVIDAYRSLIRIEPSNRPALNNLGLAYYRLRDFENAREMYERSIQADSSGNAGYINLFETQLTLGDTTAAQNTIDAFKRRLGETRTYYQMLLMQAATRRDFDAAARIAVALREAHRDDAAARAISYATEGRVALLGGQLRIAESLLEKHHEARRPPGAVVDMLNHELEQAEIEIVVRQQPERALRRITAPSVIRAFEERKVENRPYLWLAVMHAAAGDAKGARHYLTQNEQLGREIRGDDRLPVEIAEGFIALAERRPQEAVAKLRSASERRACGRCIRVRLADAFYALQQADSAIAHYEYFVNSVFAETQLRTDAMNLAVSHERLAELYDRRGDAEKAAYHAARFVDLWSEADAELQPRVSAKRELLQRLRSSRT